MLKRSNPGGFSVMSYHYIEYSKNDQISQPGTFFSFRLCSIWSYDISQIFELHKKTSDLNVSASDLKTCQSSPPNSQPFSRTVDFRQLFFHFCKSGRRISDELGEWTLKGNTSFNESPLFRSKNNKRNSRGVLSPLSERIGLIITINYSTSNCLLLNIECIDLDT